MHDPQTQAFHIRWPLGAKQFGMRTSFITIWHVDPEKDGTDDSCGWFLRSRHGDAGTLEKIKSQFRSEWEGGYAGWFRKNGDPVFSASAITLGLFQTAANVHFEDRGKAQRFVAKHLSELLYFAENPVDSLHSAIVQKYGKATSSEDRISAFASIIYAYILRLDRPWYRHPRWHVHHWTVQIHPWEAIRRRFWDKCCECGKRGFPSGVYACGDWSGKKIWHSTCDSGGKVAASST